MYEVLAMLKPDSSFSTDDMAAVLEDVSSSAKRTLTRDGSSFVIVAGDSQFHVVFSDEPHVVDESNEIADHFKVPCSNCKTRYEMTGDDPDMELFNDYLLINERLEATGQFVLFDPNEGKILFAD